MHFNNVSCQTFLLRQGKKFERKQVAKAKNGKVRTYVGLLAHEGLGVKTCMDGMFSCILL